MIIRSIISTVEALSSRPNRSDYYGPDRYPDIEPCDECGGSGKIVCRGYKHDAPCACNGTGYENCDKCCGFGVNMFDNND